MCFFFLMATSTDKDDMAEIKIMYIYQSKEKTAFVGAYQAISFLSQESDGCDMWTCLTSDGDPVVCAVKRGTYIIKKHKIKI